jgi:hypothetical protein
VRAHLLVLFGQTISAPYEQWRREQGLEPKEVRAGRSRCGLSAR